ncbi:tryptophan synthase subunit beta [uncultured Bacteroides sp.]|uniref:tryptophan synthase subunit beta n=1 Tax=uncultured Bacteroides sp. TaxID=162156 RepID=UPI002639F86B|nr:tryptophan synthase subunit beta [uncultured Bacteroides sp.]
MTTFLVDNQGYYGEFGGAYIPEILHRCVKELQDTYLGVLQSEDFRQEYERLLRDYVGRPSPLYLASRLSERYGCRIYLKREDLNHTGAHKINNTIGQILLARRMGKKRIIAETGAGQHGVATATVCALTGMECIVYMGKTDVERQHVNVEKMKMLGATVVPVTSGNMTLKDATNEAIRDWCCHPQDTYYIIGSTVGPHPYPDMVARLQSVISEEIRKQLLEQEGRDYPDYLMACVGGGSNAAGTIYHYIDDQRVKIVLAEAGGKGVESGMTAATIALGQTGIIHGARTYVIQNEDGQIEEPYSISAGLDYPGIGPMHANLAKQKRALVLSVNDDEAIRAAYRLTRLEGIIPALESAHALGALEQMHFRPTDVVVLTVSGRGDKDMETYLRERPQTENF